MGFEDLRKGARGKHTLILPLNYILTMQQGYTEHSWTPLKVHWKNPGTRGVSNGEAKNSVGDAKDESSVHDLK